MTPATSFRSLVFSFLIMAVALWPLRFASATELSTQTTSLFSGSGNCAFCHDQWGNALTDSKGADVSIGTDWRATMMAHAFSDPLWRARMEAEVLEHPELQGFIEDKCQTCHAPLARTQARRDGTNQLSFGVAESMALAGEGVSCTLCHQIQPRNLGQDASFTGQYQLNEAREIFGPYQDVFAGPMMRHVDYVPKYGEHIRNSTLCATCHTLFTPIFDGEGKVTGQFPEQTPYLEWRNSEYAKRGQHCQDCHMPRLDEWIRISSRPPWLGPRQPFWRHQFIGGNAFMLTLLSEHADQLDANAELAQFIRMIEKTRRQLGRAARINAGAERNAGMVTLTVDVENLAGHKFPTGYPYRRAWLHVKVSDRTGKILFESGEPDSSGRIRGLRGDHTRHFDVITRPAEVQIYEAVMGTAQGQATWSLLKATSYLKDNRLPPKGFTARGAERDPVQVHGQAETDDNFNADASGRDRVTYRLDLGEGTGPLVAEVKFLYQPVPPEAVTGLLKSNAPAAREFARLYSRADKSPEIIQSVRLEF